MNPANAAKDLERGKILFDHTCAACHGTGGDGQGPIVQSGAFSGVPNYADREITVGSVHYVLTNGRNAMGSYAGQLNAGDRWRVAMYVMSAFKKEQQHRQQLQRRHQQQLKRLPKLKNKKKKCIVFHQN